jgi:hypothetical protein
MGFFTFILTPPFPLPLTFPTLNLLMQCFHFFQDSVSFIVKW